MKKIKPESIRNAFTLAVVALVICFYWLSEKNGNKKCNVDYRFEVVDSLYNRTQIQQDGTETHTEF